jgi:hypothetical protein
MAGLRVNVRGDALPDKDKDARRGSWFGRLSRLEKRKSKMKIRIRNEIKSKSKRKIRMCLKCLYFTGKTWFVP